MIEETKKNLLAQIDNLEERLEEAQKTIKEYEDIKAEIKKAMVDAGIASGADQIKWTTPGGTKITCSIGHCAEFEKQMVEELDVEKLKAFYPETYNSCLVKKERSVMIKNATNNTLRITPAKEEK